MKVLLPLYDHYNLLPLFFSFFFFVFPSSIAFCSFSFSLSLLYCCQCQEKDMNLCCSLSLPLFRRLPSLFFPFDCFSRLEGVLGVAFVFLFCSFLSFAFKSLSLTDWLRLSLAFHTAFCLSWSHSVRYPVNSSQQPPMIALPVTVAAAAVRLLLLLSFSSLVAVSPRPSSPDLQLLFHFV